MEVSYIKIFTSGILQWWSPLLNVYYAWFSRKNNKKKQCKDWTTIIILLNHHFWPTRSLAVSVYNALYQFFLILRCSGSVWASAIPEKDGSLLSLIPRLSGRFNLVARQPKVLVFDDDHRSVSTAIFLQNRLLHLWMVSLQMATDKSCIVRL